jgi:CNT family concentrative nucleoside transporter
LTQENEERPVTKPDEAPRDAPAVPDDKSAEAKKGAPAAVPPTPWAWRLGILAVVIVLAGAAYLCRAPIGLRGQAAVGVLCFLGIAAACSAHLRAVNWRTVGWGMALQLLLALFVMRTVPGRLLFAGVAEVVKKFLAFTEEGSRFVFGKLADPAAMDKVFGPGNGFVFAFSALPTIIFVSAFFTVLYHFGVLQFVVRCFARAMMYLMGTSGAETLSVTANVVMGQTEAPLIVKPYIERMTQSELLALMVGGMAHISGGLMAVYIDMGADPVAILATSVMASPCSLYLAKLMLPELGEPETRGTARPVVERQHVNVIDAAASGASDGMRLALNVAAMLVAFLAFIALVNYLLHEGPAWVNGGLSWAYGQPMEVLHGTSLEGIFSWVFAPAAFLLGLDGGDVPRVADLLGTKLVANEFVAYVKYHEYYAALTPRAHKLATYALTGFANFASIGIQVGGIGAIAPSRRQDLARLGGRALLTGFLVTLINAALAGVLMGDEPAAGGVP